MPTSVLFVEIFGYYSTKINEFKNFTLRKFKREVANCIMKKQREHIYFLKKETSIKLNPNRILRRGD